jgi:hypothetical protein
MNVTEIEAHSSATARAPRVTLASMERKIIEKYFFLGTDAIEAKTNNSDTEHPLARLTICMLVLENGFVVMGKSAPASAANYREDLGQLFAYEDAIKQLWPLEGYLLREQLSVRGA